MSSAVTVEVSHMLWFVGLMTTIIGAMLRFSIGQVEKRIFERFKSIQDLQATISGQVTKAELADADNKLETARLERDLMGLRVEMAERYVKTQDLIAVRQEIQEVRKEVTAGLAKILDKLDHKVSKDECSAFGHD